MIDISSSCKQNRGSDQSFRLNMSVSISVDRLNSHPSAPSYTNSCLGMDNTMTTPE